MKNNLTNYDFLNEPIFTFFEYITDARRRANYFFFNLIKIVYYSKREYIFIPLIRFEVKKIDRQADDGNMSNQHGTSAYYL